MCVTEDNFENPDFSRLIVKNVNNMNSPSFIYINGCGTQNKQGIKGLIFPTYSPNL